MTWLETMVNRALNDPYLNELTRKLELKYAHNFLYQKDDIVLTEKEFDDVLRFADILSRSSEAEGRNKAYKIISLLYDAYKDDIQFQYYANSILTEIGKFCIFKYCSWKFRNSGYIRDCIGKRNKKSLSKSAF